MDRFQRTKGVFLGRNWYYSETWPELYVEAQRWQRETVLTLWHWPDMAVIAQASYGHVVRSGVSWGIIDEGHIMGLIRLNRDRAKAAPAVMTWDCDPIMANCPLLHEQMTATEFEDGEARQVSTLNVFVDGGVLKAFLNEKNDDLSFCRSGATIADLMANLEAALASETPPWQSKGGTNKKGRKKR